MSIQGKEHVSYPLSVIRSDVVAVYIIMFLFFSLIMIILAQ